MKSEKWKSALLILGLLLMIFSFVAFHYSNNMTLKRLEEQYEAKCEQFDYEHVLLESLKDCSGVAMEVENLVVADDSLKDYQGKVVRLSDVLGNDKKLFVRYTQENCGSCVDFILPFVRNLSDSIGADKVIFLASYDSNHLLKIFKKTNKLQNPIFNLETGKLKLPIELKNQPYLFLMDKSMKAELVFIPLKAIPQMTKDYFSVLQKRF